MSDSPTIPDGSKAILLTERREGQCRAIVVEATEHQRAFQCGESVVPRGDGVLGSWCAYHRDLYVQPWPPRPIGTKKPDGRRHNGKNMQKLLQSKRATAKTKPPATRPAEVDTTKFILLTDAAKTLGRPTATLHTWAQTGKIARIKIAGRTLFRIADIEQMVANKAKPSITASSSAAMA